MIPNNTIAPGIHNLSFEKYNALDAFNNSAGKWLNVSPAHCQAYQQGLLEKDTEPKKLGRLLHTAIFEPAAFKRVPVCPYDDFRTKDAQQWRDPLAAYLTKKQIPQIEAIVKAVHSHKEAHRLLSQPSSKGEVTLVAKDPETGIMLKARVDYMAMAVVDGKSTVDAGPGHHAFPRQMGLMRYHVQQAFYQHVMDILGIKYSGFLFLALEKEPPYAVGVYELDKMSVDKGIEEVRRLIDLYAECRENNSWPCYSDKVEVVTLPKWALTEQPFESAMGYTLEEV